MHTTRATRVRPSIFFTALAAILLIASTPVSAACGPGGCWNATIDFIRIDVDGKIWFVVEDSASLNDLIPADGCTVGVMWTGEAEPALYIRKDDPEADEKYTMLLTAFLTDTPVGFSPIKDPATGTCALGYLYVR